MSEESSRKRSKPNTRSVSGISKAVKRDSSEEEEDEDWRTKKKTTRSHKKSPAKTTQPIKASQPLGAHPHPSVSRISLFRDFLIKRERHERQTNLTKKLFDVVVYRRDVK